MGSSLTANRELPEAVRQIRSSRNMQGRYYLEKWYRIEEQKNFLPPTETKLVTPELVRFATPFPAVLDDRAFVYVESLGLIRGVISRAMGPTSEMDIEMTPNERSKLAARILWADMQAGFRGTDLRRFRRQLDRVPHRQHLADWGRDYFAPATAAVDLGYPRPDSQRDSPPYR
jgi:hypothetical protein